MRNEAKYIGKCLDSILANEFPQNEYEIIVVDGESTDNSRELVLQKVGQYPCIRLIRNRKRVVPTGLNLAIGQALGRYVIRMDAHAEYPRDYIHQCIQELERTGAENVGGRCITKPGADTNVARAIAMLTQTSVGVGHSAYRRGAGDCYVDTVPFGAFRREVFDRIGLFREDLVRHQDYELNARIRKAGGRIYLSPRICLTYYNAPTFAKFMRQAYLNGTWNARAWVRYPVSFCWRHAAPLIFVSGLGAVVLLSLLYAPFVWVLVAALSIYFIAVFAAASNIARHEGARFVWLVSVLTFLYHFVYGISYFPGLLTVPVWRRRPYPAGQHALSTLADNDSGERLPT